MRLVAIGEFGEENFRDYIKYVIKDETVINLEVWKEACNIIKRNFDEILNSKIAVKNVANFNNIDIDEYIYMIKNADKNKHFKDSFTVREIAIEKKESNKTTEQNKNDNTDQEETKVFKELDFLKSSGKNEEENSNRNEKHKFIELADSIEEVEMDTSIDEDGHLIGFEDLTKFDKKFEDSPNSNDSTYTEDEIISEDIMIDEDVSNSSEEYEDYIDEEKERVPNKKRVRDAIIAVTVVAVVVVMYFTTVGGNKGDNLSASNTKDTQTKSQTQSQNKNKESLADQKAREKAEAEKKAKEAEEKKAKEMEALKDGGGEYYRVYAGAHNTEASAKKHKSNMLQKE